VWEYRPSSALACFFVADTLDKAAGHVWLIGLVVVLALHVLVASGVTVPHMEEFRHGLGAGCIAGFLGVGAFLGVTVIADATSGLVGASSGDVGGFLLSGMLLCMPAVVALAAFGGRIALFNRYLFT
jgi:hypothetical protein